MSLVSLVVCGLLCCQVAAASNVAESPAISSSSTPASSTASAQVRVVNQEIGGRKRDERDTFGHKDNVRNKFNKGLFDLQVENDGSDNGYLGLTKNHTLVMISKGSNDSALTEQDGNFDIVMGGRFFVGSEENDIDEGDNELSNNNSNVYSLLMFPDEFSSAEFKTLHEVVAEASPVDNVLYLSDEYVESRIKKRQVSVETTDGSVKQLDGEISQDSAGEDTYLDRVRERVISVLDGRSLTEVINDRHTMKRLTPLLKLLRGKETSRRGHGKAVGVTGTKLSSGSVAISSALDGAATRVEENSSSGVDDEMKSHIQQGNGSHEPGPTSPGNSSIVSNGVEQRPSGSKTLGREEEGETFGYNTDDGTKKNIITTVEIEGTTPGKDSDVYKNFYEATNETIRVEIVNDGVVQTGTSQDEQVDTIGGNGLTNASRNSSAVRDGGIGNDSHSSGNVSLSGADEDSGYNDTWGEGGDDGGIRLNEVYVVETKRHHSNEEIHRKEDKGRKRKHKHSEIKHTDPLSASKTLNTDNVGSNGIGESGLGEQGLFSFEMENATKPFTKLSTHVAQTENSTGHVVGAEPTVGDRANIAMVSVDSEDGKRGGMNYTVHVNVGDVETNVRDDIDKIENNLLETRLNVSNIVANLEKKEHSKHHKKKTKHRHSSQLDVTDQTLHKREGNMTAANNQKKGDHSLGSLLGEVLKSVSIYEVHGNVGQINIKTDSMGDSIDGSFKNDEVGNNNVSKLSTEIDVNRTSNENNEYVDSNINSYSNKSEKHDLNQTTDTTNGNTIVLIAQRNVTGDILDQSEQIPTIKPGEKRDNSLWRKPYFQLLGYTKPMPSFNIARNQTENTTQIKSGNIENNVFTSLQDSSNSTVTQVHENKTNALSDDKRVDDYMHNRNMFQDELYEYVEQDISREEFKRENDTTDDLSRDGDGEDDDESHFSNDDNIDSDDKYEDEKSNDVTQNSGINEYHDSISHNDDKNNDNDINDDDRVKYSETNSNRTEEDSSDFDSNSSRREEDSSDDASNSSRTEEDSSDDDSNSRTEEDRSDNNEHGNSEDDAKDKYDSDYDNKGTKDNKNSDRDIYQSDNDEGSDTSSENGRESKEVKIDASDNTEENATNSGDDNKERHSSSKDADKPIVERKKDSSSGNIDLQTQNNKKVFRVKRIRQRGIPFNGTGFQKGLRIRKFRGDTFDKNGTILDEPQLVKISKDSTQSFGINGTDFMARFPLNGTDLPGHSDFRTRRIYKRLGKNGTQYLHGFKRIKVKRINDTNVSINLMDSLVQNHTRMNETSNDDGTASFNHTIEITNSAKDLELYDGEGSSTMGNTMHISQDQGQNVVQNEIHPNMRLDRLYSETTVASINIGTKARYTNSMLIYFNMLLVFYLIP